jgi:hypothetical protein
MRLDQYIKNNGWKESLILIFFILAFSGATYNHIHDIWIGGFFPYTKRWGTPEIFNWYWTGLSILDPLDIILLIFNTRAGYAMALAIMLTDVPINIYANAFYWHIPFYKNYFLLMQIAFLIFIAATFPRVWKMSALPNKKQEPNNQ